jgi:hypothetical protein
MLHPFMVLEEFINYGYNGLRNKFYQPRANTQVHSVEGYIEETKNGENCKKYFKDVLRAELNEICRSIVKDTEFVIFNPSSGVNRKEYVQSMIDSLRYFGSQMTSKGWEVESTIEDTIEDSVTYLQERFLPSEASREHGEITTARQVLAVKYLLKHCGLDNDMDKTDIARLVQFLTGKETGAKSITNTNIYKSVKRDLPLADHQHVLRQFEKWKMTPLINLVVSDIAGIN